MTRWSLFLQTPSSFYTTSWDSTLVKEYVKEKGYSDQFVQYNLYPRINGMYFSDWQGAGNMPILPVMKYFSLQEGWGLNGLSKPERMYFVNGSGDWMTKFYDAAKTRFPIVLNTEASVYASADGVYIHTSEGIERFDRVVLAQQASDALRCLKAGLTDEIARFLRSFEYHDDEVIVHTFYGVLPPDIKAWRPYNLLVRKDAAGLHPYTITYVVNRHQNDAQNSRYSHLDAPLFFVSVNPPVPIPDAYVLRQPDGAPARIVFQEVAYNLNAIKAQDRREDLQGINNVYLTGGYTCGAGLHEECWIDGIELAAYIHHADTHDDQGREHPLGVEQYALPYVR